MQAPTVAKACVVPVCGSTKFNLVHKFPADSERFEQWIEAINLNGERTVGKLANLTSDAVRKRYFVCARHFALSEYKHSASRSLNLTAVPKLNLRSIEDIAASKAGQLENYGEVTEEILEKAKAAPSQPVKILNAGSAKITLTQEPAQFSQLSSPTEDRNDDVIIDEICSFEEPPTKRVRVQRSPVKVLPVYKPSIKKVKTVAAKTFSVPKATTSIKITAMPQQSPIPVYKESPLNSRSDPPVKEPAEEAKPANKLLALIEVTPDQYEKLSKSLTAAERNENVESLINFIDKDDDRDTQAADNG